MQLTQQAVSPRAFLNIVRTLGYELKWLLHPVAAFIISRLAVFSAAILGYIMLPTDPGHWEPGSGNPLLDIWARWDSQWYQWILQEGYWLRPGQRSNVAFFPLYPLVIDFVAPFVGNNTILAGVIVSNAAFLLLLVLLYKLAFLESKSQETASRTVFYLAIFPTSFFFSMMYTESLFLLLVIAAVYFARKRLWFWAALMGLLAGTARIVGVLTLGIVLWEWLRAHGWQVETMFLKQSWRNLWNGIRKDWIQLLVIALIPLGLLSYMLFLQTSFNDPVAFSTVQAAWGRENIGPWAVVAKDLAGLSSEGLSLGNLSRVLNLTTLVSFLAVTGIIWRKLGLGYAVFTLLALLIPATSATQSILRYALACFPVFIILGMWGQHKLFDRTYTVIAAVLLGVLTAIFVNWIFVA